MAGHRRAVRDRRAGGDTDSADRGRRRDHAKPAGTRPIRRPCPARRIGLVFSSFGGREKSYQRLAGIIGKLIRGDRQVRLIA
ncbi:transcriptional regulator [Mycobacterium tuberculosis]|uniref:Uncharacterized protein n=1 Tax=Mycobacterium tuberculosis (strain CDC 1551 / Oshkosh) TaxID=83331 RepID=Q8VJJ0_MYCTO|nr:hypothetical protein MT2501 [Mycobacterium tuberculosis CDC1551]EFD54225.1 transcriptional regulator, OxyR [Mycobacterium tuberculosis 02_1987]REW10535.1 transcriptional regulator [Mycobacterium tuberculosis]